MSQRKTKHFDVTNLTTAQRRELFKIYVLQRGFTAFIKNQNNKQTQYTFQYQN